MPTTSANRSFNLNSLDLGSGTWTLLLILVVFFCVGAIFRSSAADYRAFSYGFRWLLIALAVSVLTQFLLLFVPHLRTRDAMSVFGFFTVLSNLAVVAMALVSLRGLIYAYLLPSHRTPPSAPPPNSPPPLRGPHPGPKPNPISSNPPSG